MHIRLSYTAENKTTCSTRLIFQTPCAPFCFSRNESSLTHKAEDNKPHPLIPNSLLTHAYLSTCIPPLPFRFVVVCPHVELVALGYWSLRPGKNGRLGLLLPGSLQGSSLAKDRWVSPGGGRGRVLLAPARDSFPRAHRSISLCPAAKRFLP